MASYRASRTGWSSCSPTYRRPEPDGRPTDSLFRRRLHSALFQHLVEHDPRVRKHREWQERRRRCSHFGEQPDLGLPSTLLPYANFFVGAGNPQPLVDGNGAGILKNVGINFETDALTGFPNSTTAAPTPGAARSAYSISSIWISSSSSRWRLCSRLAIRPWHRRLRPQYGFGARYQIPIDRAWLFRADATYHLLGGGQDSFGLRTEVRRKF